MATILILIIFLIHKSLSSTCYLSNSFLNLHENVSLALLRNINSKIEQNALAFINKTSNYDSDNNNTTAKHAYHFYNLLRDTNTISKKLDKLYDLSTHFSHKDHATQTDKITKRSTILNLGVLAPYVGLASIDNINDIHTALKALDRNLESTNLDLNTRLNHIDNSLTLIAKTHDLENIKLLKTTHLIFFYLKMNHLTLNLLQEIRDIEFSFGSWKSGFPTNIIFDSSKIHTLKKDTHSDTFPLFTASNFTLLPRSLFQVAVINDIISHSISIPLISPDHICNCQNKSPFTCGHFSTNHNIQDCIKINSNSFFCNTRPCLYNNNNNNTCYRLDNDQLFILAPQVHQSCAITRGYNIEQQFVLQENISKVIILGPKKRLNCNNFHILPSFSQEKSLMADLIFNLDTIKEEIKDSSLTNSTMILKKINNFIRSTSNFSAAASYNRTIHTQISSILNHPNMILSNTTLTFIICLLLIIWLIKSALKNHKKNNKDLEF